MGESGANTRFYSQTRLLLNLHHTKAASHQLYHEGHEKRGTRCGGKGALLILRRENRIFFFYWSVEPRLRRGAARGGNILRFWIENRFSDLLKK